jgi:hypothetical protein
LGSRISREETTAGKEIQNRNNHLLDIIHSPAAVLVFYLLQLLIEKYFRILIESRHV